MGNKQIIVNGHDVICDAEYSIWAEDLEQSYRTAQANAILKINFEKYQIDRRHFKRTPVLAV